MNIQKLRDLALIFSPNKEKIGESYIIYSTELDCFLHCKQNPVHPSDEEYTDGWECVQVIKNAVQLAVYLEQHNMTIEQRQRARELGFKILLDFVVEDLGILGVEFHKKDDPDAPMSIILVKPLTSKQTPKLIVSASTETIVKGIENYAD